MFRITKYGYDVVITILVITFLVFISSLFLKNNYVRLIIDIFFFVLFVFTIYFFRDPERVTPMDENSLIAPADGEICLITKVENDKYLNSGATQISIFMSPLNVHVNRIPMSGKITFKKHIQGQFHVAYVDKASEENEQTVAIIENLKHKIEIKQIAGYIARRVVNPLDIGDEVKQGDRFGMIKFGSRVDVIVPYDIQLKVKLGDKVTAGETILCQFN
jgi:phosphatidylserine decarboxylase